MTIYCVDRSNNNPPSDAELDQMKSAGIAGLILKATEGTGYTDSTFVDRARAAVARGFVLGAYAFIHANEDAQAQAALFNTVVASANVACPIRCADAETPDGDVQGTVDAFCPAANINLLYSGAYFARDHLMTPIPGVDWWIAAYGANRPAAPWGTEAGWQFTDASQWGDCSVFDDAVWAQLIGAPPTPTPAPDEEDEMLIAKDEMDAKRAWVRRLFAAELGGNRPMSVDEQEAWVQHLIAVGEDLCTAHMHDQPEAANFRARRGW